MWRLVLCPSIVPAQDSSSPAHSAWLPRHRWKLIRQEKSRYRFSPLPRSKMGSETAPEVHHEDDIRPYVPPVHQNNIDRDEEVSSHSPDGFCRPLTYVRRSQHTPVHLELSSTTRPTRSCFGQSTEGSSPACLEHIFVSPLTKERLGLPQSWESRQMRI